MTKISVILPTNKLTSKEEEKKIGKIFNKTFKDEIINEEFTSICQALSGENEPSHILNPTIECLRWQNFDDFEVLLCHKYPDDVKQIVDWHNVMEKNLGFNIKLIKEKPSIWHELGAYPTVNNNRNTGLIHAKGELIFFLDDMTIFENDLLQRVWDKYKDGYYVTCRGMRRIREDSSYEPPAESERGYYYTNGVYSSRNFKYVDDCMEITNTATWTYGCSVSLKECLEINGFDEIYDGNFGGTDQDFGRRLNMISKYKRKLVGNIYEFAHKSPRQVTRNDEVFRQMCGQAPLPRVSRANSWKPNQSQLNRYERWHLTNTNMDPNWNKFMEVPLYDIEGARMLEQL